MKLLLDQWRRIIPTGVLRVVRYVPIALVANVRYGFPSRGLTVIGVTGTDGKTTTATLIYEGLTEAGKKAGLVSTVSCRYAGQEEPTGLHVTSPDPMLLQKILREMAQRGVEYVVLETTSHGLEQARFWGVPFYAGVVTNVTRDHFDYHRSYERYLAAKGRLFRRVSLAILNKDDRSFAYLQSVLPVQAKITTYARVQKADFTPRTFPFKTTLPGDFNQENCLAAAATLISLGISDVLVRLTLKKFRGVRGRLEEVPNTRGITIFVDFAHTPNALEQVLKTLRRSMKGKLIAVFGSAGKRDVGKRPLMGEAAGRWADLVVLTADDPRYENVAEINRQIGRGCEKAGCRLLKKSQIPSTQKGYYSIPNRKEAITFALTQLARRGDTVVLCGKGHEESISIGGEEVPWSDREVALEVIEHE